jgi:hypothetical protein
VSVITSPVIVENLEQICLLNGLPRDFDSATGKTAASLARASIMSVHIIVTHVNPQKFHTARRFKANSFHSTLPFVGSAFNSSVGKMLLERRKKFKCRN